MRLFESQPEWLRSEAPAVAPSIPYAIPVAPMPSPPGLLRRSLMAVVLMLVAVGAGAFLNPYLPKPEGKPSTEAAPVVATTKAEESPKPHAQPVPSAPPVVVQPAPVAPAVPVVAAPKPEPKPPTPEPKVDLPKVEAKPKPKAVVVEEPPVAAKPFYLDKAEAQKAAKKDGKRVLYWIDGADEQPGAETIIKNLGERVVHCRLDADGEGDSVGPRIAWTGEDGTKWFTRARNFGPHSPNNIRSKMGLPTISASGKEITFPQVVPPQEARYKNFADRPGDGNCLWVSCDTLLKTHGYNVSLSRNRWGGSNIPWAVAELKKRDVRIAYKDHFRGKDKAFLQAACDEGLGCVVTVMLPQGGHAIDLVGIQGNKVAIIDNNDPQLKTRITPLASFEQIWDGGAIAILPRDYNGPLAQHVRQCAPGGNCPSPALSPFAGGGRNPTGQQRDADAPGGPEAPLDTGAFGAPIIKSGASVEAAARQFFKDAGFTDAEIEQRIRNK